MGRHRGQGASLKRRVAVRKPRKTIALYCEGRRTEPDYFGALKKQPAVQATAAVDLIIDTQCGGHAPLTLVRTAIDAKRRNVREQNEVDEFWCVFDVEWPQNHPALREALTLAETHGIFVAVSNPCFELWLALHFGAHRSWLDNDDARRLRRRHDGQEDKGVAGDIYMPLREIATKHAKALDDMHAKNGTEFPKNNPSTGVHLLLASISVPSDKQ